MKKTFCIASVVAALVVMTAGAAAAHEEINPSNPQTGRPTFLTLSVANEKESDLVSVSLIAPKGVAFGETTRAPAGWSVKRTEDKITWSGGKVASESFEDFGFEVEEFPQPGPLTYKVSMGFANRETEAADVVVNVTAAITTPSPSSSATSTLSASSARSRANLALAFGVLSLGLASVAIVFGLRRATSGAAAGPPPEGKDW